MIVALAAFAVVFAASSGAGLTDSTFEGADGDMVVNRGGTDWASFSGSASLRTLSDLVNSTSDDAFTQGSNEDDPNVVIADGSIPNNKADLSRAYVASETVASQAFLYLAWERASLNGTVNFDFELNQQATPAWTASTVGDVTINRTEGDVLITYDFNGNANGLADLALLHWLTPNNGHADGDCTKSGQKLPCWGNRVVLTTASNPPAEGAVNLSAITDPLDGNASLDALLFGEAKINLSDPSLGVFSPDTCRAFGSISVNSRASDAFDSEMKDFIAPVPIHIANCGSIELKKHWVGPAGSATLNVGTSASAHDTAQTTVNGADGTTGETEVENGTYYVSESGVNASYTSSLACTDNGSPVTPGANDSLSVTEGHQVVCQFTNTKIPQVKVNKTLLPSSDAGRFDLQLDGQTAGTGSNVGDGGTTGFVNESVGATPTVGEAAHSGTDLSHYVSSISCSNGQSGSGTSLKLNALAAGDQVTCTITNKRKPTLTVTKTLLPANDTGTFNLQIDGQTAGTGANVGDGGTTGAVEVSIGSHTVGEAAGTGTSLSDYAAAIGGDCAANGSITLAAGDNATCTITNTKRATIVVKKVMEGGTGSFDFTGHPAGTISTNNGTLTEHVAPGHEYVSTESPAAGWQLTDVSCTTGGSGDAAAGTATFDPTPGQTVTCTFTNTKVGSITVVKHAVGGNDSFLYTTSDNLDPASFSLDTTNGSAQRVYNDLLPDTYTVTEGDAPAGWTFTSLDCGDAQGVSVSGQEATIDLAAGQDVTCTYTNTKQATVVVKKVMEGGTGSFDFTGDPAGTISTDGGTLSESVAPGAEYVSTETPADGWKLTDVSCTDGGTGDSAAGKATFDPAAGQTITCTFTNTKLGSITVVKDAVGGDDSFLFTASDNLDPAGFSLDTENGTAQTAYTGLLPGSYSVAEGDAPAGWHLTGLDCGGAAGVQTGGATATIDLGAGEDVTCTWTNTKNGTLEIVKNTLGGDGTFDFSSTGGLPAPADEGGAFQLTTGEGSATQDFSVAPGEYTVAEAAKEGWSLTGLSCGDGGSVDEGNPAQADVTVPAGGFVRCTFENTKLASLTVIKVVDNSNGGGSKGPGDFTLSVSHLGGSPVGSAPGAGAPGTTYSDLAPGTYVVSEAAVSGYSLTGMSGDCSFPDGVVTLTAGESATCTLTNTSAAPPPPPPPPPPAPKIDLSITKVGTPNPATLNGNVTWTVVVTNNGPNGATGVTLADAIPAGTTFVSVASSQGTCTGGAVVNCDLGNMAAGANATITLVTTAVATGTLTNTGTVVGKEQETNTANNSASASVVVNGPFKPPVNFCTAVTVAPKQLFVGRSTLVKLRIVKHGKHVAGVRVNIRGKQLGVVVGTKGDQVIVRTPGHGKGVAFTFLKKSKQWVVRYTKSHQGIVVTKPSAGNGVITLRIYAKQAGIVTFAPVASKRCGTPRVGVTGVFTPPVTG